MRIIEPTALVAEAADVLAPVRELVVLVGAGAVDIALAGAEAAITPTRDVDLVVGTERVATVVERLEADDFRRSPLPYERAFTWVRGELRVQLVRAFHPFPRGPARGLPENPVFGLAEDSAHHDEVAFTTDPEQPRLLCARPLCLVALKQAAFGRMRGADKELVERDYHDVYLILRHAGAALLADMPHAGYEVRQRARSAVEQLAAAGEPTASAARQMVALREADTQRDAEDAVRRVALRAARELFG